jgi:hypothetical protein
MKTTVNIMQMIERDLPMIQGDLMKARIKSAILLAADQEQARRAARKGMEALRAKQKAAEGKLPAYGIDVKNMNNRELLDNDSGFSLMAETTQDGDRIAAERRAKAEAKAAQDAAQGDLFGGNAPTE